MRLVPVAALLFSPLLFVRGQSGNGEFKLTAESDLVLIDASIKDVKGGYVSDLTKENFQVYENGKRQKITQFGKDDDPITAGLVIDDSRSMRAKRREVVMASLVFIDSSNPLDEMFVTHFNDRVRHGLPAGSLFSGDPELLRRALWNSPSEGMTSMYDGILDALHQLESGKESKKSLIVISDGGDNASTHGFKDVVDAARTSRAIIYTIGLFDPDDVDRNPALLRRLSHITGGEAYEPHDLSELEGICRGIAKDIRNRYTIGYVPVRADDTRTEDKGSLRTIRVAVTGAGNRKFIIHARTSYILPNLP